MPREEDLFIFDEDLDEEIDGSPCDACNAWDRGNCLPCPFGHILPVDC